MTRTPTQIELPADLGARLNASLGNHVGALVAQKPIPTITLAQIAANGACGDGRGALKRGARVNLNTDITDEMPLTLEFITRAVYNQVNWPIGRFPSWGGPHARRVTTTAAYLLAEFVLEDQGVGHAEVRTLLDEVRTALVQEACGNLERFRDRASSVHGGTSGTPQNVALLIYRGASRAPGEMVPLITRLYPHLTPVQASEVVARALEAAQGIGVDMRPYATPLQYGQVIRIGELRFEVREGPGGVPTFEREVYRLPQGGEVWTLKHPGGPAATVGVDHLILAGASQALRMTDGVLLPLDGEGQLPGTVRGLGWTFKRARTQ